MSREKVRRERVIEEGEGEGGRRVRRERVREGGE